MAEKGVEEQVLAMERLRLLLEQKSIILNFWLGTLKALSLKR